MGHQVRVNGGQDNKFRFLSYFFQQHKACLVNLMTSNIKGIVGGYAPSINLSLAIVQALLHVEIICFIF